MQVATWQLHTIDARIKLVSTICLVVTIALLQDLCVLTLALLLSVILLVFSKPALQMTVKRILTVNVFVLFLWIFTPFTTQGQCVFSLWILEASYEGLILATSVTLKANAISCVFIALLANMELAKLCHAMQALHIHHKFIFLFLFTRHALTILQTEWQALTLATKLRCFEARANWHSYVTLATLLGILIIKSFEHARRAYEALLLRGFTGKFFAPIELQVRLSDLVFLGLSLGLSLGLIIFQVILRYYI